MFEKLLDTVRDRGVNYWSDRLLAQIEYACKLSKVNGGAYDSLIDSACTFVIEKYRKEGAVTCGTVTESEGMLSSLSTKAKAFNMICAAHAHIDMNWMWGFNETVAITLETLRTMLELMKEYPDYRFSQSQASVYKIVEDHDPQMLEEIRKRVKEGRWEVTASTWVETDKNMPNGESLARHILYTKKYLSELLDLDPDTLNIDFEPDTFGHNINVPEILNRGKIKYYYHCRGFDKYTLYRWEAPSGSSVIVYREPLWYNSHIDSSMASYVPEFCDKHGIDTMMKVYGVGDHGGGPTRRDIERIIDMNTWPVFPKISFGTFGEYFALLEKASDRLPVVKGELNFIFDGCYTTQTRIKKGNRYSEAMLNEAEMFNSISSISMGEKYPAGDFTRAWRNVLFNHFHDIIPGSGVVETREYASGLYQETLALANTKKTIAFRKIAENINTRAMVPELENLKETVSEGAGVGFGIKDLKISQTSRGAGKHRIFHMFNSAMHEVEKVVEVIVWDWQGKTERLTVKDENGNEAGHQVVSSGFNEYWGHHYMSMLIKAKVPACGYSTYVLSENTDTKKDFPPPPDTRVQLIDDYTLENSRIRAQFDSKNASLVSLIDKATGEELICGTKGGGVFRYIEEDGIKGMSAWIVGRYMNVENLVKDVKINWVKNSASNLRNSLNYEIKVKNSNIKVNVSLDENSSFLNYEVECDWKETGVPGKMIPQLGFQLSASYTCDSYKFDVPFGTIERKGIDMDVPANSWVLGKRSDAGRKGLILVTDSKYGFRCNDDTISVTLIRSSFDPDPYPEFGIHKFSFAVGTADSSASNRQLIDMAYAYNHSLNVLSGKITEGTQAPAYSFMKLDSGNAAVSAVKMPESGEADRMLIRVYETDGSRTAAELQFAKMPEHAWFADINENIIETEEVKLQLDGNKLKFEMDPYKVASIIVKF